MAGRYGDGLLGQVVDAVALGRDLAKRSKGRRAVIAKKGKVIVRKVKRVFRRKGDDWPTLGQGKGDVFKGGRV